MRLTFWPPDRQDTGLLPVPFLALADNGEANKDESRG